MVGQWPPPGLCSFSPERRRSADVKTIRELRISVTKQDERGWMSENYPSLQPREKCFLLTSPFIEPGFLVVEEGIHGSLPLISASKRLANQSYFRVANDARVVGSSSIEMPGAATSTVSPLPVLERKGRHPNRGCRPAQW